MERLRLDGAENLRQHDHRQSILTGSSVSSASLCTPSLSISHEEAAIASDACPPRPAFAQHPTISSFHSASVSISSSTSSSWPVSAPTESSAHVRQFGLYEATRVVGASYPYNLSDLSRRSNVLTACVPCKKAHLGCDTERPCRRCVNLGKVNLCADIPHKKRGRPKQPKTPLSEPYSRVPRPLTSAPPSLAGSISSRHRGSISSTTSSAAFSSYGVLTDFAPTASISPSGLPTSPSESIVARSPYQSPSEVFSSPPTSPLNDVFELFTTVDFGIVRTTPAVRHLTGYHSYEFLNVPLADFLHPHDAHLAYRDGTRLLPAPAWTSASRRETVLAVNELAPRELLSPAQGMFEPYPNQNVRFRKASGEFAWFNLRIHVGGGLGADLRRPDTLNQVYFVISLLHLDQRLVSQPLSRSTIVPRLYNASHPEIARTARPFPPSPSDMPSANGSSSLTAAISSGTPSLSSVPPLPNDSYVNLDDAVPGLRPSKAPGPERTLGTHSPLQTTFFSVAPSRTSPRLSAALRPATDHGQTHPAYTYLSHGPPPLSLAMTIPGAASQSRLIGAPIGAEPPLSTPIAYRVSSGMTVPFPQYPPRDPDGPPELREDRSRKISGRSDNSGRAWEL